MTEHVQQVGGDHYEVRGQQHWDVMEEADIAYLEATATKYIIRWRKKGGSEDLRKAASYLERAVVEGRGARRLALPPVVAALVRSYALLPWEQHLLELILLSGSVGDFSEAASLLRVKADQLDQPSAAEAPALR